MLAELILPMRYTRTIYFNNERVAKRSKTSARFPSTERVANRLRLLRQIVRMRHKQTVKENLAYRVGVAGPDVSNETIVKCDNNVHRIGQYYIM